MAGATLLIYLAFQNWGYDDPYITYRYARNIAGGDGFVYNPGERVLSTTTPLFALLLAGLSFFTQALPQAAIFIGAASLAAGALMLLDLSRCWETPIIGWVALFLYPTFSLPLLTLGSETPLVLALCLGTFQSYARRRFKTTGVLAGLAVLTRPDGILVPAVLAIDFCLQRYGDVRRKDQSAWREKPGPVVDAIPWQALVAFLAVTLPWVAFAWAYFGSPIPATLQAKQLQGEMEITQRFAAGLITTLKTYYAAWYYKIEAALALAGLCWAVIKQRRWLALFAWTAAYFVAYTWLGVGRYFWYYAPLALGFIAAMGLGFEAIYAASKRSSGQFAAPTSRLLAAGITASLAMLLGLFQIRGVSNIHQHPDTRLPIYRAVGEWLSTKTPNDSLVGALEVGIIGYYSNRRMLDFAGLIQPSVARNFTADATYEDTALWATDHYRPETLVLQRGAFPRLETLALARGCSLSATFAGKNYAHTWDLDLYTCRLEESP
mgnify:CR=1 FL=1